VLCSVSFEPKTSFATTTTSKWRLNWVWEKARRRSQRPRKKERRKEKSARRNARRSRDTTKTLKLLFLFFLKFVIVKLNYGSYCYQRKFYKPHSYRLRQRIILKEVFLPSCKHLLHQSSNFELRAQLGIPTSCIG